MSRFAGIDLKSTFVDAVVRDEQTGHATHHRWRLDLTPGDSITRTRRLRDQMPARGAWADDGVLAVAIERPGGGSGLGLAVLFRVYGAVLACLPSPPLLTVYDLTSSQWRKLVLGHGHAPKRASVAYARDEWPNRPEILDDNAADAFCLAVAAERTFYNTTAAKGRRQGVHA